MPNSTAEIIAKVHDNLTVSALLCTDLGPNVGAPGLSLPTSPVALTADADAHAQTWRLTGPSSTRRTDTRRSSTRRGESVAWDGDEAASRCWVRAKRRMPECSGAQAQELARRICGNLPRAESIPAAKVPSCKKTWQQECSAKASLHEGPRLVIAMNTTAQTCQCRTQRSPNEMRLLSTLKSYNDRASAPPEQMPVTRTGNL